MGLPPPAMITSKISIVLLFADFIFRTRLRNTS